MRYEALAATGSETGVTPAKSVRSETLVRTLEELLWEVTTTP